MAEGSLFRTTSIERVQEGMAVRDQAGKRLGTVAYIKLGDPDAMTGRGERLSDPASSAVERIAEVLPFTAEREPQVPEPFRSRLLRVGFLKVDGPGLADADRYVAADDVVAVDADAVRVRRSLPEGDARA
jgi:hypothetical protein